MLPESLLLVVIGLGMAAYFFCKQYAIRGITCAVIAFVRSAAPEFLPATNAAGPE